ncbi:hypothetical protein FD63_12750 [Xanthomonas translucens pv. undulosa]|nr:hypothetical protein FD63_12750 [Xanthomonas translucens pv. undulosa]
MAAGDFSDLLIALQVGMSLQLMARQHRLGHGAAPRERLLTDGELMAPLIAQCRQFIEQLIAAGLRTEIVQVSCHFRIESRFVSLVVVKRLRVNSTILGWDGHGDSGDRLLEMG